MMGTIECPMCKKHWEKDFSKFPDVFKNSGFNCKCPCGHSFAIKLERRRHDRKQTDLTGSYLHDKTKARGLINIKNLSRSGVGLELNTRQPMPRGDKLLLKFNLDDAKKSYLCREAIVKKSDGSRVGLEFSDSDPDENIEFYLKNKKD